MRRAVIPLFLAIAALACARTPDPNRRDVSQESLSLPGASVEPRALQVALDTIRAVTAKRMVMIVPDTLGNIELARMAAGYVGGGVRSAAEGIACAGAFIPRCPFQSTLDTVSIRIHSRAVTQDSVQLAIDAWGLMHIRGNSGPVEFFYERYLVAMISRMGEWVVAEVKLDFVT